MGQGDVPILADTPLTPGSNTHRPSFETQIPRITGLVQSSSLACPPKGSLAAGVHTPGPAEGSRNGYRLGYLLYELEEAG